MSISLGIFHGRNYALYAAGNTIFSLGTWAQRIGVGWLSWDLSQSASWVGIVALSQFLPIILFSPLYGTVLERCDTKRYAIATSCLLAIVAITLWWLTAWQAMTIERLWLMSLLLGVVAAAHHPVRLSILNVLAPEGRLPEAIATNSILYNLSRSLGPALAGFAIAWLGVAATFAVNAVCSIALIAALAVVDVRISGRSSTAGFMQEFFAGIRYVAGVRAVRELMLLSIVIAVFGRGVVELLPALAGGLYDRGSAGLAILTCASGLGAIIGGVLLSGTLRRPSTGALARRSALWVGAAVVALSVVPSFASAVAAVLILGIVGVMCGLGLQTSLQALIEESFRGRVLGLWAVCNVAGPGIGGALIGASTHLLGLRGAIVASGVMCMALVAWINELGRRGEEASPEKCSST